MEHNLFTCACEDVAHQFVISYDKDDLNEIFISVHLNPNSFWRRLKNGINYILGKESKYGDFEEIILSKDNINKLLTILKSVQDAVHD